ncbi:MAG: SMP-30/gluconolactonase/LRE family protein [Planctomycetales bacterium]|nr:SMP-30/gluconolactonase/LRE family protein [Planctomycetales bacterium]
MKLTRRLPLLASTIVLTAIAATLAQDAKPARGLVYPLDVSVTADAKTLYLVDRKLPGLWKAGADGKLAVFFQASKKFRTPLNAVRCIAADGKGGLLVGDSGTREVYRFSADGKSTPLTKGGIGIAMGIAVNAKGTIFVSDLELQRIWTVPAAGGEPKEFAVLPAPRGMTFDKKGQLWVVSGGPRNQLVKIAADGKITPVVKDRTFVYPNDVAVSADGTAFVSDGYADCIWKVAADGKTSKWVSGKPLDNPVGLDWQGTTLLVVDSRAGKLFSITPDAKLAPVSLGK